MVNPPASAGDNSSHKETGTRFPCPICSLGFSSSSGLKRHISGHKRNPTAHLAHLLDATGYRCRDCSAQFNSQAGLSQHRRHAHPAEYNDEKLARRPQSQYNWSKLEDSTLLNMASALTCPGETKKQLYAKLVSLFPYRTTEAIKKRLQHLSRSAPQRPVTSPVPLPEECLSTTSINHAPHEANPTTPISISPIHTPLSPYQNNSTTVTHSADPQTVSPSIPPAVFSTPPISLPSPAIHLPPSEPNIHSPSIDPNIHIPSSGSPINTAPLPVSSCISRSVDNSVHCTLKRLPAGRKMAISRMSSSKSFRKVGAAGKDLESTQRTLTSMWQHQQIPGDQSLRPRPQKPASPVGEFADTSAEQLQELHQSSLPTDMDVDSPSQPPHTIVHPCSLTPTHLHFALLLLLIAFFPFCLAVTFAEQRAHKRRNLLSLISFGWIDRSFAPVEKASKSGFRPPIFSIGAEPRTEYRPVSGRSALTLLGNGLVRVPRNRQ
ncbi:uncharacterized protein DEA37_0001538 [Paragonimus westermani]|uniref:C2H2-type domain-containing protein n=1 Tax=Paragonimus westermani TaxID=34504 RepID=A0A5J4NHB8_9TREM|nr:uncharacterized protein DEA37_0001538 [Paragonimus westermani]